MKKAVYLFVLLLLAFQIPVEAAAVEKNFSIEITDEDVKAVIFTVIKPNELGVDSFEGLTSANIGGAVYTVEFYERTSRENETVQFQLSIPDEQPRGTYKTRLTLVNEIPEKTVSVYDSFEVMDEKEIKRLHEAPANEVLPILQEFVTEKGFFPLAELGEAEKTQNFGEYFVAVRTAYFKDGYTNEVADITENVQLALFAQSLLTKSEEMHARIIKYGNNERFAFDDYEKLTEGMQGKVLKRFQSETTLGTYEVEKAFAELRTAIGLTIFGSGTVLEKADALVEYRGEIGIEMIEDEAERIGIARYLTGEPNSWSELKADIENAKEKYENEQPKEPTQPSRGNGGGGKTIARVDADEMQTNPEPPQPDTSNDIFNDLNGYDWAREDILALAEKKVVNGAEDGGYHPEKQVTRAEFCKMIVVACGLESTEISAAFQDVVQEQWHYPYVMAAYREGLIQGVSETEFWPDAPITRQDIATILCRVPGLKNKLAGAEANFTDAAEISDYATAAVAGLTEAGILTGYEDGSFRGRAHATKAEAAVMVCRLIRYMEGIQ